MILSGNFFEVIYNLFYFLLGVAQVLYDFLFYKVDLNYGEIDLGIVKIPLGLDISFYPTLIFGAQMFFFLITLRLIKKFVPFA